MSGRRTEFGPSWWDVERLVVDFQKTWRRKLRIVFCPHHDPYSGAVTWSILVTTFLVVENKEVSVRGKNWPFRGKSGASTVPAAVTMALSALWAELEAEDANSVAQMSLLPPVD